MDSPMVSAAFVTVMFGVAALWIFHFVRADFRAARSACICQHIQKRHVSALDWDSDYGDPGHTGTSYKKPGLCRDCRCQYFIADYRAKH